MSLNWGTVGRDDVLEAVSVFDRTQPSYGNPRGLYVFVDSGKYPAKFIRMLAYNIRNDASISEDRFKGGSYTVRFFNALGFDVEDNGVCYFASSKTNPKTIKSESNPNAKVKSFEGSSSGSSETGRIRMSTKNVLEQKNALQLILNRVFDGDLVNEKSFEWMRSPGEPETTYPVLYGALRDYRGFDSFAGNGRSLACDFVSESNGVIIEYDERQHFSQARLVSLQAYPDVDLCFDKDLWIRASGDIQAVDNTPPDRDEARAYYDSIRDIEAYNHGYRLIRIMHGEFDFERSDALEYVEDLIGRYVSHDFGTKTLGNTSRDTLRACNKTAGDKQRMSTSNQKNALQLILNMLCDNDLVCEKAFEWLRTPEDPRKYPELHDSLREYNDGNPIGKNAYRLHCDFVSESNKLIIEYDERGHFTEARRISLLNYPDVELHYDKDKWIKKCEETKAKTNSRYNSSVARAYYDSIRDIEAYHHGYRLIRIMHGDFDFERDDAVGYVRKLIEKEL